MSHSPDATASPTNAPQGNPDSSMDAHMDINDTGDSKSQADMIEIRCLIDNASVGGIIGKGGNNVRSVRESSGCYVSILKSDYRSVQERIMLLKGQPEHIAKAAHMICELLIESAANKEKREMGSAATPPDMAALKLLVHKAAVGAIIGKAGQAIKDTQNNTGARIQVSNDPLPSSTEKSVTISGSPQSVHDAVFTITQQLKDNPLRAGTKSFTYVPGQAYTSYRERDERIERPYRERRETSSASSHSDGPTCTQKIAIPTVCAGCVIGKGGSVIRDLRAQSGTNISIADPDSRTPNERVVTLTGNAQGIQTAVHLIRQLVEQYQPAPANDADGSN